MGDRLGQQLGNYRLVKLLGKGGFAEVYLGQHVRLASKQTAIKILHLIDVDARKFQEEAETTEKLVHPHIVRLLDFDIEQGTPFLVLDYAPGGSLRTRHPKGSRVPLARVGEYLKELAPALQYAHDQHILHRDIKPDNMLIGRGGELLLSDFGIAVLTQTGRTSLSSAYGIGGTPSYMAPETYRGRPEKASDQYALAVVVYEWLCGRVPFSEGNFIQLGFQHSHEPVPPLRERNLAIPPEVEAVIMKALSKEPKDRFASVQTFVQAFEEACIQARQAEQERLQAEEEERARQDREERARQAKEEWEKARAERARQAEAERRRQAEKAEQARLAEEERRRQTEEERRQAEEETARQEKEQADKLEEERVRKAKETALAATEVATTEPQPPLPTEVARSAKPPALRPDARVAVKPAQPGASRRFVLLVLAGLVIVALASGIAWFTVHHGFSGTLSITEFSTPTANSGPGASTAGPDGNLWFNEGTAIGRISPSGTITEFPLPTANSVIPGITAGPDGNLWFTETSGNKIGRISPSGTITEFPLPTAQSRPLGITAGPDGNLWFTETSGNKIGRISPSGTITEFPLHSSPPEGTGITAGPDGNLWFTEFSDNEIGRISPGGTITEFPVPTDKSYPYSITAGPDGNLWFTESSGSKIGRFTPGK